MGTLLLNEKISGGHLLGVFTILAGIILISVKRTAS